MIRLTPRQHAALTFVAAYTAQHGQPPTLAEIAAHLGVSKQRAQQIRVQITVRRGIEHRQYAQRPPLAVPREVVAKVKS